MATRRHGANRVRFCAECGERIVRGRAPGVFVHTTRVIAACDLDADHAAVPPRRGLDENPCRHCDEPTVDEAGTFVRGEPARDDDHAAEPALPPS